MLVRWTEQPRGAAPPTFWSATLTVVHVPPRTTGEYERNPLGLFVTNYQITQTQDPEVMSRAPTSSAGAAVAALAGCAGDTSVQTTPTFSAARYLPDRPAAQAPVAGPTPEPHPENVRGLTGVKAISAANREATVEPDDASMRGATWYIEDAQPSMIYRVCTANQPRDHDPAAAGRALQRRGRRRRRRAS